MISPLRSRVSKVRQMLKAFGRPAALMATTATPAIRSRDQYHDFRQNSDFYYLTGSLMRDAVLLITSESPRAAIFTVKPTAKKLVWEDRPESPAAAARAIGADVENVSDLPKTVRQALNGLDVVFASPDAGSLSAQILHPLIETPAGLRLKEPRGVLHSDVILERLRLFKDKGELALIEEAARKTNLSLFRSLAFARPGVTEREYALTLEYLFRMHGTDVAFPTIAAAGKNAATLHHSPGRTKITAGQFFLIDCGAEVGMYGADITRSLPIGAISPEHELLYGAVLEAQSSALSTIRHGVLIKDVYEAAAKVIIRALLKLKVLDGSVNSNLRSGAFREYFPHGIGHSLGLDVHDVGNLRGNNAARLEEGMVFTVEPGVYLRRKAGRAPACGIRIEDDVLVGRRGCKLLTAGFPKDLREVEQLLA